MSSWFEEISESQSVSFPCNQQQRKCCMWIKRLPSAQPGHCKGLATSTLPDRIEGVQAWNRATGGTLRQFFEGPCPTSLVIFCRHRWIQNNANHESCICMYVSFLLQFPTFRALGLLGTVLCQSRIWQHGKARLPCRISLARAAANAPFSALQMSWFPGKSVGSHHP